MFAAPALFPKASPNELVKRTKLLYHISTFPEKCSTTLVIYDYGPFHLKPFFSPLFQRLS